MNILVRADSSSKIGLGHIMRDLVLVKRYKKDTVIFATQDLKGNINQKIIESNHKVKILKSNKMKELILLIKELDINLLIIDHYEINRDDEKLLKKKTDIKILVLDDTYEKHHCDILLNHNLGADSDRYKNKLPSSCLIQCGEEFTLLRDEFIKEKNKLKKQKKQKHIFIAMGGSDASELNIKVLKIVQKFTQIKVHLVTSTANKNLHKLQKYADKKTWLKLHIDSTNIAKLMRKSDMAIVSASVTLNEVHFMNLPYIAIKTAPNQKDLYEYLRTQGKQTLAFFDKNTLHYKFALMLGGLNNAS